MKTALIISGGDFSPLPFYLKYDYCIACDKGYSYTQRMNITPNLVLGDFDSSEKPNLPDSIQLLSYPVEKDDTDTMLAIKKALELGYNHIIIACALGKRMDHTLANIQSAAYVANEGGICEIISETEYFRTLIGGENIALPKKEHCSLSLFALSDNCEGLTIRGAKYCVEDVSITNRFPIGCSNSWISDTAEISLKSGIILIVESSLLSEEK